MPQQSAIKTVSAVNDTTVSMPVRQGESLDYSIVGAMSATIQLQSSFNNFLGYDVEQSFTAAAAGRIEKSPGKLYRLICTAYVSGSPVMTLTGVADVIQRFQGGDGREFGVSEDGPYMGSNRVQAAQLVSVDVACTAALLDASTGTGKINVVPAGLAADQYKVRGITLVGGGTSFGAGGDRLLSLTDGTTVYTTIANADLEAAPAASLPYGNAKVPMLTNTSDVATAAGAALYFQYSGGTPATPHTTGSIRFNVLLEKVA